MKSTRSIHPVVAQTMAVICFGWITALGAQATVSAQTAGVSDIQKSAGDHTTAQLQSISLTDVHGHVHRPFDTPETKACVLIFVSADCPIANAFQPYLRDFHAAYSDRGIQTFFVYCSSQITTSRIETHVADFKIQIPAIPDNDQRIGRLVDATATPESIVIDRQGKIRYRGAINNLYAGFGKKRSKPTQHAMRDACDAILDGKSIVVRQTKPVGCFIHYANPKSNHSNPDAKHD